MSTNDALYGLVYVCQVKVARIDVIMVSHNEIHQFESSILSGVHIQVFIMSPLPFIPIISKMKELHRPNYTLSNFHIDWHFDMNKYSSHQSEFLEVKQQQNCKKKSKRTLLQ